MICFVIVSFLEERAKNMGGGGGQNIMTDAKSVLNMSITVTVSAQKPPAPHGYISISTKRLLHNLEINAGARASVWVDSMRASSPTHIKSTPHDQGSWNVSSKAISTLQQNWVCSFFNPIKILICFVATPSICLGDV